MRHPVNKAITGCAGKKNAEISVSCVVLHKKNEGRSRSVSPILMMRCLTQQNLAADDKPYA